MFGNFRSTPLIPYIAWKSTNLPKKSRKITTFLENFNFLAIFYVKVWLNIKGGPKKVKNSPETTFAALSPAQTLQITIFSGNQQCYKKKSPNYHIFQKFKFLAGKLRFCYVS
jgi:hypothetical protein